MAAEESSGKSSPFSRGYDGSVFEFDGRFDEDVFDDLLVWASDNKTSDITIQSGQKVVADIGGQKPRVTHRALTLPEVEGIVRYIYGENGPAEIKSGYDLDPSYEVRIQNKGRLRFRVNITGGRMPGADGIQITIRTLPEVPIDIHTLGIEQDIIDNFRPSQGMVLVTGPTGSGKSTLLSSGIRMIMENPENHEKILEYSAPIEYIYDKIMEQGSPSFIHQVEVGRHLRPKSDDKSQESLFAYSVRNSLRRAPDIIIIGETRDRATAEASIQAAETGHLLYSTMHTNGVPETIRRALMWFPGEERHSIAIDLMEVMRMIITQILVPRKGGGMIACREYMVFDAAIRNLFLDINADEWSQRIRKMLENKEVTGASMEQSARKLLEQDLIEERTYRMIAARSDSNRR